MKTRVAAIAALCLIGSPAGGQLIDPSGRCVVQPDGHCTPLPSAGGTPWYAGPLPGQQGPYQGVPPSQYAPQVPQYASGSYTFCYSLGPVAGTHNMFVSNVFGSNADPEQDAETFERFADSQGTPVYFGCRHGTNLIAMQQMLQQKIISLANQGYSIAQIRHR